MSNAAADGVHRPAAFARTNRRRLGDVARAIVTGTADLTGMTGPPPAAAH
jgi:hypothetical protein